MNETRGVLRGGCCLTLTTEMYVQPRLCMESFFQNDIRFALVDFYFGNRAG